MVGDTNGLERWLGARLLRHDERPVPLDEGVITGDGRHRFIDGLSGIETTTPGYVRRVPTGKGSSQEIVIPLVRKLVADGQQVIVFRQQVGETRGCAEYLANALGLAEAKDAIERLPRGDQSMSSTVLRQVLGGGVAFHNSHLSPEERRIVEEEFRAVDSDIKVIVATTTLAMGVNTPASSVVVVGLQHPGDAPYSIAEYKNLVGRAGRLGFSEHGASYLVAMTGNDEHHYWRQYVLGRPEALRSRFLDKGTDPRSLVIRMLASSKRVAPRGLTAENIAAFLERSFGGFQEREKLGDAWCWSRRDLARALADLVRHGLVTDEGEDRHQLTELGVLAGETGLEVASVIRLVDALRPVRADDISDPVLIAAVQHTVELDGVNVPINKKTQKEAQTWLGVLREQGIVEAVLRCFGFEAREPYEQGARAKRAVAALAYIGGQEMTDIEAMLQKHGGGFGGSAGPIRGISARTCDVVGTAARIAEILHPGLDLAYRSERLKIRLNLGIPGPATDLGREAGQELTRGNYLALTRTDLTSSERIMMASDIEILSCVDESPERLVVVRKAAAAMQTRSKVRDDSAPYLAPYAA